VVVTVMLRLLPGPLDSGELVGHAEDVATGEVASIRGVGDVIEAALAAHRRGVQRSAHAGEIARGTPSAELPQNG
jgi:hypothetical protein